MKAHVRTAAFTLIEILVVMAIIATLAALVVPMLFKSTETANQTQCQSNLRQIYLALTDYKMKKGKGRHFPRYDGKKFVAALYRKGVLEDASVLICPSTDDENNDGEDLGGMGSDPRDEVRKGTVSYAGRRNSKESDFTITKSRMKKTAVTKIALACDGLVRVEDSWLFPHGDMVLALFLDGSVRRLDVDEDLKGIKKIGEGAEKPLDGLSNE
ncbi:MAG: prepilin-type N-terminal cleavage/methylation domain-containing protein [Planctomycetota bacterium]|jgi:prepilin-type N-terminal cleavage/methylation domain-containing protein